MREITDLAAAQQTDDRALYAPLRDRRAADFPALRTFAACSGDCHQGRRLCVTPEACRLAEHNDDMTAGMGAVVVPAVVAFSLACAALVAFLGGWL